MDLMENKWYSAILQRRSRRQFNRKALPDGILERLNEFSRKLNDHVLGSKIIVVNENPDHVFKGAVGSYGKIKGAPAYVAFVGNMDDEAVQEKVGYAGELFVLEATSLGVGTCWVGGFFRPEVVGTQIKLAPHERVLAVSPLGYVSKLLSFEEKVMSGLATSHKRKRLETLLTDVPSQPWPSWLKSSLEAARLAPSAVNRQPWRFTVEEEAVKITVDSPTNSYHISKRLDCGIAMAHLEIGAAHEGVTGQWELLTGLEVARFKLV